MRVKNRLSSYPILNRYDQASHDFREGNTIMSDISLRSEFENYICDVEFNINCPSIEALIRQDYAQYCVHVESPSSCFREEHLSKEKTIHFSFRNTLVNDAIEINTFVVLIKDFPNYHLPEFHADYENECFDLHKHQIIAIGDAVKYPCSKKEMDKLSSIIKIRRIDNDADGVMTVNTDDDSNYIFVGLQAEAFDSYCNLGKNMYRKTALSLVLFPALVVILERMYLAHKELDEDTTSKHWYQIIENQLEKNNIKIDSLDIQHSDLLKVAQSLFGEPIRSAFEELDKISVGEE